MRRSSDAVTVTPVTLCPCTLEGNRASVIHALCRGSGHLPLLDQQTTIRALVSRFSARWVQAEIGVTVPGDILVSPLPRDPVILGQWDILQLQGWERGEPFEGERFEVGALDINGRGPRQNFLTYVPKAIQQLVSVEGTQVTLYQAGVDYTLAGHVITWLSDAIPVPGTILSCKYLAIMEYVVVEIPDVRYERGTDLGRRVLARKRHLMQLGNTYNQDFQGPTF